MNITTLPSALNNVDQLKKTLFQRVKDYVAITPWNLPQKDRHIDVSLPETTVCCTFMNEPGERGLVIYLDPDRGDDGELYFESRALILMLQSVDEPDTFFPCLVRSHQPWEPYPEAGELRLAAEVLEALTFFLQANEDELSLVLSSDREVEVCWGFVTDYDPMVVTRMELEDLADTLWRNQNHEEGARQCALLVLMDSTLEWRQKLASHLYAMGMFEDLEELWRKFRADNSEEWLYVGALCALKRGKTRTFERRLEKAARKDTYGFSLLGKDDYSDEFLRRWRPFWCAEPKAVAALKEALARFYPRIASDF